MIRSLFMTTLLAFAVVVSACNAADPKPNSAKPRVYELVSVEKSQIAQQKMTDFTWEENGKKVKLSEYAKGKIVFLNFWATWCPPCRKEIPDIVEISNEMKKDVVVVGISFDRGDAKSVVEKYAVSKNIEYINIIGNDAISAAYGGIQYIPTTFIIGRDGTIAARMDGAFAKDQFMQAIKKAQ
jgi:thiol-disulfide isomerase/thioredoxin